MEKIIFGEGTDRDISLCSLPLPHVTKDTFPKINAMMVDTVPKIR
jgi:hypothetical protein